jgi:hypothetical protein
MFVTLAFKAICVVRDPNRRSNSNAGWYVGQRVDLMEVKELNSEQVRIDETRASNTWVAIERVPECSDPGKPVYQPEHLENPHA